MSHHEDYIDAVARLAAAGGKQDAVPAAVYARTVTTLLHKIYDGDYLDEAETLLARTLPELTGQPRCTATDIDPRYLAWLVTHPQRLPDHYRTVRQYLTLKIDNLEVLSADERALMTQMPELDGAHTMTHAITPTLLHEAAANPEGISDDLYRDLERYLGDKVIDRQALTGDEAQLMAYINDGIAPADASDVIASGARGIPAPEFAGLEYGYDPYDFGALLWRLAMLYGLQIYASRPPLYEDEDKFQRDVPDNEISPLTRREQRVILTAWGFDPSDRAAVEAVFNAYHQAIDVFNAEETHQAYIAGQQRYRNLERDGAGSA